ncbi:RacA protein [Alteribacter lacisalsi]|jgi:chromosome-anchoring protein RacA|uniref:Chromosome-anchoring protein RacA n=1 Tax=Alteribacter lacisalsi TaxID=2045244 RepID=A0A2W0HX99_9BACI|nr:chromosome-anchoring protein RacA [Alteribacter lacisalsi]PYZ98378.1 RacA protein [Alteribacter lacisalsi]
MSTAFKTKTVADQLGVNPTTVQRWIKYFDLKCETNELGHFVLPEETCHFLKQIHVQLNEGKKLKDVRFTPVKEVYTEENNDHNGNGQVVSSRIFDERFGQILLHVDQLEKKLSEKADEVVEYQMLQHRQEIDELADLLRRVDKRLKKLEQSVVDKEKQVLYMNRKDPSRPKKRMLANIFSFSFR